MMKDCTTIPNDVYRIILTSKEVNKTNCLALYSVLFFTRDFKTNKSHISYNKIVDLLGWGNSRISNTIKELESLGLIKYDRGNELIHKTNTFTFPLSKKIKEDSEVKPAKEEPIKEDINPVKEDIKPVKEDIKPVKPTRKNKSTRKNCF